MQCFRKRVSVDGHVYRTLKVVLAYGKDSEGGTCTLENPGLDGPRVRSSSEGRGVMPRSSHGWSPAALNARSVCTNACRLLATEAERSGLAGSTWLQNECLAQGESAGM